MNFFFYGSLRDKEILSMVAGDSILSKYSGKGLLKGAQTYYVLGQHYPVIVPESGAITPGVIYLGLNLQEVRRIHLYETSDYLIHLWPIECIDLHGQMTIEKNQIQTQTQIEAFVYGFSLSILQSQRKWNFEEWQKLGRNQALKTLASQKHLFNPQRTITLGNKLF